MADTAARINPDDEDVAVGEESDTTTVTPVVDSLAAATKVTTKVCINGRCLESSPFEIA